jgi:hypothetical protein
MFSKTPRTAIRCNGYPGTGQDLTRRGSLKETSVNLLERLAGGPTDDWRRPNRRPRTRERCVLFPGPPW